MKINVIGNSPSSGSTILSDILDSHKKLLSGPELNLFGNGRIFDFSRFKENPFQSGITSSFYVSDVKLNSHRLYSYSLNESYFNEIVQANNSYEEFLDDFTEFYSIARNKRRAMLFSEKTPENINVINRSVWKEDFQFTTIVRSPIYVFDSLIRRGFSPLSAITTWYFDTLKYFSHSEKPYVNLLRYEEMVDNPYSYISKFLLNSFEINIDPSELEIGLYHNEYRKLHRFGSKKSVLPWRIDSSSHVQNGNNYKISPEIERLFYSVLNICINDKYASFFEMERVPLVDLIQSLEYDLDTSRISKSPAVEDKGFKKLEASKVSSLATTGVNVTKCLKHRIDKLELFNAKRVLIISSGSINRSPRVRKEIQALQSDYRISLAMDDPGISSAWNSVPLRKDNYSSLTFHHNYPKLVRKVISLGLRILFKNRVESKDQIKTRRFRNLFAQLNKEEFDLIIAHHPEGLLLGAELKKSKNVPLVFNLHEHYLREFEDRPGWVESTARRYQEIFDKCMPIVDTCFHVCDAIKSEYSSLYPSKALTIRNDKKFYELQPSDCSKGVIKVIHHGAAIPGRRIEDMISMMDYLDDRFHLYLMMTYTDQDYYNSLMSKANKRVTFLDAVDFDEIPIILNKMDIGLFILPPVNYNWEFALPNKLFEFIQGRLCIAISPNPEMKAIVENYQLGIVAEDYSPKSMAKALSELSVDSIMGFKRNSHKYASELSSEETESIISREVSSLLCAE